MAHWLVEENETGISGHSPIIFFRDARRFFFRDAQKVSVIVGPCSDGFGCVAVDIHFEASWSGP